MRGKRKVRPHVLILLLFLKGGPLDEGKQIPKFVKKRIKRNVSWLHHNQDAI